MQARVRARVGLVTAATVWPFSRFGVAHIWAVLYFSLAASTIMALTGVVAGLPAVAIVGLDGPLPAQAEQIPWV